jgi:hypothetical protein
MLLKRMLITDLQKRIYAIAWEHEGRYLLARRFHRLRHRVSDPTELDLLYEACGELVNQGFARWMRGQFAPGIKLTGKPLPI